MYEISQLINTSIIISGIATVIFITTFTYQYIKLRKRSLKWTNINIVLEEEEASGQLV